MLDPLAYSLRMCERFKHLILIRLKPNRANKINSWSRRFVFREKIMITGEDKVSMFASRNMYIYLIYYGKNMWSHLSILDVF